MPASMLQLPRFCACRRWFELIFFLLLIILLQLPAQAQKVKKADCLNHSTRSAGNKIYKVAIEDFPQEGVGLYTVSTDSLHPITRQFGKAQDLLAGGTSGRKSRSLPGTSYTTIRSYTSGTDYVQSRFAVNDPASGFTTIWLDSALCNEDGCLFDPAQYITPIGDSNNPTGFAVTYNLPGFFRNKSRDNLRIVQKLNVRGNAFDNSWVEVTTIVENTGKNSIEIGIRYLWDLNIGGDDGPEVFQKPFDTSLGLQETRIDRLNFVFAMATPNDTIGAAPPKYNVFASVITPANFSRAPDQPTLLQLVSWPLAFFHAFDYDVHENLTISTPADPNAGLTGGDNALQYFWGRDRNSPLTISPGGSVRVTQVLLASINDVPPLFDFEPPVCKLTAVKQGPPKSFVFVVQDPVSGLLFLRAQNASNVKVKIPSFTIGSTDPVKVVGTVIDETQPFGFTLVVRDVSGNESRCDPIFLTLQPELHANEQRFELLDSDRYFYIENQGIRRIVANLNGHEFILSAAPSGDRPARNTFAMPLQGEMMIDMLRYLETGDNTMTIAFDGPEGSRADLVISDMTIKSSVDLVLDLAPVPQQFALSQNLPNPFRGATEIRFEVPERANLIGGVSRIELKIYNLLGQVVRTLIEMDLPAGSYTTRWNGRNAGGKVAPSGIYFYVLTTDNVRITKKMTLIQ